MHSIRLAQNCGSGKTTNQRALIVGKFLLKEMIGYEILFCDFCFRFNFMASNQQDLEDDPGFLDFGEIGDEE
jgi:hypothetical protein